MSERLDGEQAQQILDFMRQVDAVLAVIDFDRQEVDEQVARLIEERTRTAKPRIFARPTPCEMSFCHWAFA